MHKYRKVIVKVIWSFFNVLAIVVVSTLLKFYFASDGAIPIWKFIPHLASILKPMFIADAAGIYIFSLLFGLFGLFYKPNRWLGFMLVSWVYIFLKVYMFSQMYR